MAYPSTLKVGAVHFSETQKLLRDCGITSQKPIFFIVTAVRMADTKE
jgi:hypothetical protein